MTVKMSLYPGSIPTTNTEPRSSRTLTQEELDFFSPPLSLENTCQELFRTSYASPRQTCFQHQPTARLCAILSEDEQHIPPLLQKLCRMAEDAEHVLVCDPPPSGLKHLLPPSIFVLPDPVFQKDGTLIPRGLKMLLDMAHGSSQHVRHLLFPTLTPKIPHQVAKLARTQAEICTAETFFFTFFAGSLNAEDLAVVLTNYTAIITPERHYCNTNIRLRQITNTPRRLFEGFTEYQRLTQKNTFMESMLDSLPVPLVAGNADGTLCGANSAFLALTGYSSFEISTLNWLTDIVDSSFLATQEALFEAMIETGNPQEFQTSLRSARGEILSSNVQLYPQRTGDHIAFFYATFNIQETDAQQPFCVLKSQETFLLQLRLALQRQARQHTNGCALLALGVEHNLSYTDEEKHELLQLISRRTISCLRTQDFPSSFDPETLFVLLDGPVDVIDTARVARRIQQEIESPLTFLQDEADIHCSIGVVHPGRSAMTENEVMQEARTALARATQRGASHITFYDERQNDEVLHFLRVEKELQQALQTSSLHPYFLPLHNSQGAITGLEAQLYWEHPRRGLLSGRKFLPVIHQSDVARDLDLACLTKACAELSKLSSEKQDSLLLMTELSLKSILKRDLIEKIQLAFQKQGLCCKLAFTIKEKWLAQHKKAVLAFCQRAQKAQILLVLDQFAASIATLADLTAMPLYGLKLGEYSESSKHLTAAIATLATQQGLILFVPHTSLTAYDELCARYGCTFVEFAVTQSTPLSAQGMQQLLTAQTQGTTSVY